MYISIYKQYNDFENSKQWDDIIQHDLIIDKFTHEEVHLHFWVIVSPKIGGRTTKILYKLPVCDVPEKIQ